MSKVHAVAMFSIVALETILNAEFLGMYIIYLRTKFRVCIFNETLVVIRPKGKYRFRTTAILFPHVFQRKTFL
jgi:hypothetical protein